MVVRIRKTSNAPDEAALQTRGDQNDRRSLAAETRKNWGGRVCGCRG